MVKELTRRGHVLHYTQHSLAIQLANVYMLGRRTRSYDAPVVRRINSHSISSLMLWDRKGILTAVFESAVNLSCIRGRDVWRTCYKIPGVSRRPVTADGIFMSSSKHFNHSVLVHGTL